MIASLKERAARFIVKKRVPVGEFSQRNFSSIFAKTYSFLVLMPANESDFRFVFPILEYLREQRKNIVVMTYDFRVSLLQPYFKTNARIKMMAYAMNSFFNATGYIKSVTSDLSSKFSWSTSGEKPSK